MANLILTTKIIVLLWLLNFIPPFLAFIFQDRFNTPLDGNKTFFDGQPILGPHKTIRGFVGSIVCGGLTAHLFSLSLLQGVALGILTMLGDIITSFIKRRLKLSSGTVVPGLDQFLEAFLPLVFWKYINNISWHYVVLATFIFSVGAFEGSRFFKLTILKPPSTNYPRPLRPRIRLREWKSCQLDNQLWKVFFNFEDAIFYHLFLYGILQITSTYSIGLKNALNIKHRTVDLYFSKLPPAFDGYSILFMSDLHIDAHDQLQNRLEKLLQNINQRHDLCILAGDFRFDNFGSPAEAIEKLIDITPKLTSLNNDGILAVLGNHDCIEMSFFLERHGIRFLLNENITIQRGSDVIYISGVDDPHYFKCHNVDKAFRGVDKNSFSIFIAHSPELYREAYLHGADLYLCGHTHAGQIALPKIGPVFTHSRTGRRFVYGIWQYREMTGYTSSGVGSSGIFARFGTQPEVVTIRLRRKDNLRST